MKDSVKIEDRTRLIASLEIVTAVGILMFWIAFYTVGMAPEKPPTCYFAYKGSFLLPDTLLAILLMVSGILLMKGKPKGKKLSLVAASALVFLGLLDCCFNFLNGVYAASTIDLVINAFINAWCVGLGMAIAVLQKE